MDARERQVCDQHMRAIRKDVAPGASSNPNISFVILYRIFFSLPVSSFFRATIKRQKMHWQFFLNIVHGFCSDFFFSLRRVCYPLELDHFEWCVCGGKESEIVGNGVKYTNYS